MTTSVETQFSFSPDVGLDANGIGHANIQLDQGWVSFYNESIFGIIVFFADGENIYLPTNMRRIWRIDQPSSKITWVILNELSVAPGTATLDTVTIETLDEHDVELAHDMVQLAGGVANVGNSVLTANLLKNISTVAAVQVVGCDCQNVANPNPSQLGWNSDGSGTGGDGGPLATQYWQVDDLGNWKMQSLAIGVGPGFAAASISKLGIFQGILYQAFGNTGGGDFATFEGVDVAGGGKTWAAFMAAAGTLYFKNTTDNKVPLTLTSTGVSFLTGGKLAGISYFGAGGSGTVNHGLGATPLWIGITQNVAGSSTIGINTVTGTQVTVNIGGNQAISFWGAAFS